MPLNKTEKLIVEAISSMLKQDARLGLPVQQDEVAHNSQFKWEAIDDAFELKISGSPFADVISSAFFAVHSHKYIDHPSFKLSFEKEMTARGVPEEERQQAIKYLEQLIKEVSVKEQDAGWNHQIKDISDMTSNADIRGPKPSEPFSGGGPAPK